MQYHFFPPEPTAIWSVSELTRRLRDLLDDTPDLQDLWVQGEVSNFSRAASGHIYFTLKDAACQLRGVMWKGQARSLTTIPRNGDSVEVFGRLGLYEAGGQYQFYAEKMRPVGQGDLYLAFERLKAQLEAEGLFAPERKRPLPQRPRIIGIVTSAGAAALRDILNTIERRYRLARLILAATPVQGVEAPAGIVAALELLAALPEPPEVILVARGGGSIEDLWAFNNELVARAICACPIPVISGVGHEIDFTICDFVSDLRAATPTAAAEQATPHRDDLLAEVDAQQRRLYRAVAGRVGVERHALLRLESRLARRSPAARLGSDRQRLDELARRSLTDLTHRLALERQKLLGLRLHLEALNPLAILARGYAVVTDAHGAIVSRVAQAAPGANLQVQVSDGRFTVNVPPPAAGEG